MKQASPRLCLFVGALLLLSPVVTFAHHSVNAFFDTTTVSDLEGTLTRIFWRNPHVGFVLLTGGEEWELEGTPINSLERSGIHRELFGIGDRVRVAGWPDKRGGNTLFITNLILPDGNELQMTVSNPQPLRWTDGSQTSSGEDTGVAAASDLESRGRGIFRAWARGELYRARQPLVFTPLASNARAVWEPVIDDPSIRCIPPGMPNAILNPFPIEFVDEGDTIRLRIEEWEAVLTIHMTSELDPRTVTPSPLGHSVGRWEDRTLVVNTNRVNWPLLDADGTPQSDEVEMVQRFTISEDENRLDFEITVTDPQYLAEPAVWDAVYIWDPTVAIKPYECEVEPAN